MAIAERRFRPEFAAPGDVLDLGLAELVPSRPEHVAIAQPGDLTDMVARVQPPLTQLVKRDLGPLDQLALVPVSDHPSPLGSGFLERAESVGLLVPLAGGARADIDHEPVPGSPRPLVTLWIGSVAACSLHGWDSWGADGVGQYRQILVQPATALGVTVLSLGHPPKDPSRQKERDGYGAGQWLGQVDGVAFRMVAGSTPIGKGRSGSSAVYSVKDRNGSVEEHAILDPKAGESWYYLGQFMVDNTTPVLDDMPPITVARLTVPDPDENGAGRDGIDRLADDVAAWLADNGGQFSSQAQLIKELRADGIKVNSNDLGPAIIRLERDGRLVPMIKGQSRGGTLASLDHGPTAPDSPRDVEGQ